MKGKNPKMILKIDLVKAFDRLKWSFIRDTLHFIIFPTNISPFIMCCVSSSSISILVNGGKLNTSTPPEASDRATPCFPTSSYSVWRGFLEISTKWSIPGNRLLSKPPQQGPRSHICFFVDDLTLFS
uniref:Putative ovule protein n=1 Tax=Solanum chacoense TaxID=4108 RepID=A0A0V0IZB7_SOLCH